MEFVQAAANDKSWRIRYILAEKIPELAKLLGSANLLSIFVKFLQDPESEVKVITTNRAAEFCKLLDAKAITANILPHLVTLSKDPIVHVRRSFVFNRVEALAENVLPLAGLVGATGTKAHILPIFLTLIKDTSADVRLLLLKNLEELNKVIGVENISDSLMGAINQLAGDKKWRVRMTVIDYSIIMAKIMGEKLFQEKFGTLCLSWLDDNVYAIRESAIKTIKEVTAILGSKWAEKFVLPKLFSYQTHSNYLFRMSPLFAISLIAPLLSQEAIEGKVMPFVLNQMADKVPNIRFNVAKCLKVMTPLLKNESLKAAAMKALTQLGSDSDFDVRYHSAKSNSK